jgi:ubiquinone/menaquinone biosynthesis C-methylase UbiE
LSAGAAAGAIVPIPAAPKRPGSRSSLAVLACLALLGACHGAEADADRAPTARDFPRADRPISKTGATSFASEVQRDSRNEAKTVMDLAEIKPGMTVADIGAGEGYYTVRLGERVGPEGRVLAGDIDPAVIERLGARVQRERLDNVSIRLGTPDDPKLPVNSFDRIFLVHMYHEVGEPYAFLWRLRPALRPSGRVVVVDVDRPTGSHGIPPRLLFCEFSALGFRLARFVRKPEMQGYYAEFEATGARPAPAAIKPCRLAGENAGE